MTRRCEFPITRKTTRPYWKRLPNAERYEFEPDAPFGLPFRPTPFRASDGCSPLTAPVTGRQTGAVPLRRSESRGRKAHGAHGRAAGWPEGDAAYRDRARRPRCASAAIDREVRVTVTNHGKGLADGEVRMNQPAFAEATAGKPEWNHCTGSTAGQRSRARTNLKPCDSCCALARRLRWETMSSGRRRRPARQKFETGLQAVEYAHIRRRQLEIPASVAVKVMDVRLAPNLTVGYVMGTGDEVPAALRGLGASVQLLDADALSWADLSRYDAIFIGVRAYDSRAGPSRQQQTDPRLRGRRWNRHRSVQPRQHLDPIRAVCGRVQQHACDR